MKTYAVIAVYGALLLIAGCANPIKDKLKGSWHSKDGATRLNITDKDFTLDDGEAIAEDYFIKGDTICTSFQGNQPYTRFVIQKLTDHYLKLTGPDSVAVEYSK